MKQVIICEARLEPGSGVLLSCVAAALENLRLSPDSLVWSRFHDSEEVRLWMIVDAPDAVHATLVERCRDLPFVSFVSTAPAELRSPMLDRIRALESRSPFADTPPPID